VKIRLRRIGAKKQPAYRIVIADARAPRDGRFIEIIGHYNPLTEPSEVAIDSDRALHWLRNGAQPTEVVQRMLVKTGVWSEYTGEPISAVEEAEAAETPTPAEEAQAETEAPEETVVEAAPVEETPQVEAVAEAPGEAEGETAQAEEQAADTEDRA